MRKISLVLITVLLVSLAYAQSPKGKSIYVKEFKWKIVIPAGFDALGQDVQDAYKKKGLDAIEKNVGQVVDDQTTNIFYYGSERINVIEALYQPFDEETEGEYNEVNRAIGDLLYDTFVQQMPGAKIDSTWTVKNIDGLDFNLFAVEIVLPNGKLMTMEMYSRLFGKQELTINITYIDEQKGKLMKEAFFNSTFKKEH